MFDPYYETNVNPKIPNISSWTGGAFIVMGLSMIVFTIVDLTLGMTFVNGSSWQENSIWPTIGKGIWVGAIVIATGIIGVITVFERTQVGLYVFNGFTWTTVIFSLYLAISSILHFEPYIIYGLPVDYHQNMEFTMNILLLATGSICFVFALFVAFLTCRTGNCFMDRRVIMFYYEFEI